jgi:hypothetical protein
MENFIVSLIASLIAVLLSVWIEKLRMPQLVINAPESANWDNSNGLSDLRWKFFRVEVENKKFPKLLSWIPRQTVENCRAKIEFFKVGELSHLFVFNGRWASTPELVYLQSQEQYIKLLVPDPVTIPVCQKEKLDVFVKEGTDDCAYGWNNESYFNQWKNQKYKLEKGEYIVKVTINTQNGNSFSRKFKLGIRKRIEDSFIEVQS